MPVEVEPLLTARGASVWLVTELLAPGVADATIASVAADREFIVITHDKDFGFGLSTASGARPCVIIVRPGSRSAEDVFRAICRALAKARAAEGSWLAVAKLRKSGDIKVRVPIIESGSGPPA